MRMKKSLLALTLSSSLALPLAAFVPAAFAQSGGTGGTSVGAGSSASGSVKAPAAGTEGTAAGAASTSSGATSAPLGSGSDTSAGFNAGGNSAPFGSAFRRLWPRQWL